MIDFNSCTMDDVIERSLTMHPSLLGDRIAAAAKIHQQARDTMFDGPARKVSAEMATACWAMFKAIQDQEFRAAELDLPSRILAFGAASKLNCLSYNVAHAIASRG